MNEQIVSDVTEFRKLKAESDALDEKMKVIKARLFSAVEANGEKYQDKHGYVRIVIRKASVSCKDALELWHNARDWAKSDTPAVEVIGKVVCKHFTQKDGYSYLQVK